jgi:acetoin utilization deacetylase AcuC-like enzyme
MSAFEMPGAADSATIVALDDTVVAVASAEHLENALPPVALAETAAAALEAAVVVAADQTQIDTADAPCTLIVHHPACEGHSIEDHPEQPARVSAILSALRSTEFAGTVIYELAPKATADQILLCHSKQHLDSIMLTCKRAAKAKHRRFELDGDTSIMSASEEAILRASGSVCHAVDEVMAARAVNSFCCVRPPGHHARPKTAMGFCFFNNVAIGALYAHEHYGLERVAVVDFDVHVSGSK